MSKKLIAIALAGLFVFSAVSVKADTLSDLQAIITSLTAQIAALQAQITTLSGGTTGTVCFNTDLQKGMTSDDVKNLQIKLGVTPTSGYFGTITFAAVKTFQTAHGIINTGYVGPLTRAALNTLYCTPVTTTTTAAGTTTTTLATAAEGTLTVTQYPIPGTGTITVYGGNTNKEVAAYKMKATNSDIRIKRVLLQMNLTSDFPWRALTSISLWDGSTLLKEVPVNSTNLTEITFASAYQVTLDGFDVLVAKDTEKIISLKVTANSVPQYASTIFVSLPANAVRGVDTASLNVYGPASSILTTAHSFTMSTAQSPTITVTAATDNPLAGNVIGNSANITRVDLLKFNVKVENVGATLKGGVVTVTESVTSTITAVELYDGTTLLSSAAPSGGSATWSTYTSLASAGTTKVLTVKGVIKSGPTPGATVAISLPVTTGLTGVDANGASLPANQAVTGNTMYVYLIAPTFVYSTSGSTVTGSNPNAGHPNDLGSASITFTVTANGGDIYIATTTTEGMKDNIGPTAPTSSDAWSCNSPAETNTSANFWRIPSGSTASCTFTDQITNTAGTAGWFQPTINQISWMTSATTTGNIDQVLGLSTLKTTPQFYLGI